jgi:hypothetical protein
MNECKADFINANTYVLLAKKRLKQNSLTKQNTSFMPFQLGTCTEALKL